MPTASQRLSIMFPYLLNTFPESAVGRPVSTVEYPDLVVDACCELCNVQDEIVGRLAVV